MCRWNHNDALITYNLHDNFTTKCDGKHITIPEIPQCVYCVVQNVKVCKENTPGTKGKMCPVLTKPGTCRQN